MSFLRNISFSEPVMSLYLGQEGFLLAIFHGNTACIIPNVHEELQHVVSVKNY